VSLLSTVASIVGACWAFYFVAVYPILAIYHCGKNSKLGWFRRSAWIVAMAVLGPLAAAFYYLKHPAGKSPRRDAYLALITVVAMAFWTVSELNSALDSAAKSVEQSLPTLDGTIARDVTPADRQAFIGQVTELGNEMATLPFLDVSRRLNRYTLYEGLVALQTRGNLTSDDIRFWEGLYAQRDSMGVIDLASQVESRVVSGLLGS
jgi:hypothetical protein